MKKIIVVFFVLIFPLFFSTPVKAVSGACSGHGGVNCLAGADGDGSVICNDGWSGSTVNYYNAEECSSSKFIYIDDIDQYNKIINEIQVSCSSEKSSITSSYQQQIQKTEQDYLELENSLKSRLMKLGINPSDSSWTNAINGHVQRLGDAKQQIMNEMNLYLAQSDSKCSEKKSLYIYDKDLYNKVCISKLGNNSTFNKIKKECECLDGYNIVFNPLSFSPTCQKIIICEPGYFLNNGICVQNHAELIDDKIDSPRKGDALPIVNIVHDSVVNKTEPVIDHALSDKLKGRILLQVESHGEAWYVSPTDSRKYYMADGSKAYEVMRTLGVGITNKDLEKIKSNKILAKKHSGKIFLQVESHGEAYYIDFNGTTNYLKDGAAAHEVMRSLGLGITNDNLNKISEGSF